MTIDLHFGNQGTISLPATVADVCDAPRGAPLVGLGEAVDLALAEPRGFPPLALAALPGDRVALALSSGVPQAATLVERALAVLVANGVAPRDITLVRTAEDAAVQSSDPLALVPSDIRQAIAVQVHDPSRRDQLSYLAASTSARPIYVNRAIHDADLVISIGCLRCAGAVGYFGAGSSLFPAFSDAANFSRYHSSRACAAPQRERLQKQAAEVSWLLGAQFTIQVVPGAAGRVLHVLAGEMGAVCQEGNRLCDAAWSVEVSRRSGLVVATIEGDRTEQTWENVGRALAAAAAAVDEEGTVVLCTELAERPGPALQQIIGADDLVEVLESIDTNHPADALPATELVHALQRGRVYLISQLDEELVEDLGISPLSAAHIPRLLAHHASCTVLANAHYATVRAPEEPAQRRPHGKSKSRP